MIYFSTWMYKETISDGGLYGQVGGLTYSEEKQLIYWRCVLVFFKLAHDHCQHRIDVQLYLFTNIERLPIIDGIDLHDYLASMNVKIVKIEYQMRPDFPSKWYYNQFYVFDILNWFSSVSTDQDYIIISDSDCLVIDHLDPLFDVLRRDSYLTMDQIAGSPDESVSNITLRDAATLYAILGGAIRPAVAPYYGGEFFGLSRHNAIQVLEIARHAFEINNERAKAGLLYLTEEAHLLSFALVQQGLEPANANIFIRRIWTHWRVNTHRASDMNLLIWHVLAEKSHGIAKLAKAIASDIRLSKTRFSNDKIRLAKQLGVGDVYVRHFLGHFFSAVITRMKTSAMKAKS